MQTHEKGAVINKHFDVITRVARHQSDEVPAAGTQADDCEDSHHRADARKQTTEKNKSRLRADRHKGHQCVEKTICNATNMGYYEWSNRERDGPAIIPTKSRIKKVINAGTAARQGPTSHMSSGGVRV